MEVRYLCQSSFLSFLQNLKFIIARFCKKERNMSKFQLSTFTVVSIEKLLKDIASHKVTNYQLAEKAAASLDFHATELT